MCGFDFFFFKQKTAYEIKECDWSSDVCSSDLAHRPDDHRVHSPSTPALSPASGADQGPDHGAGLGDRKSVV